MKTDRAMKTDKTDDSDIVLVRCLKWLIEGYDLGYFNKADVIKRGMDILQHQDWIDGL